MTWIHEEGTTLEVLGARDKSRYPGALVRSALAPTCMVTAMRLRIREQQMSQDRPSAGRVGTRLTGILADRRVKFARLTLSVRLAAWDTDCQRTANRVSCC